MRFFIDTAKVEDIKKANDMGVICGVTTNPSLIAKEGRDFKEVIKEITEIVDGPISGLSILFLLNFHLLLLFLYLYNSSYFSYLFGYLFLIEHHLLDFFDFRHLFLCFLCILIFL